MDGDVPTLDRRRTIRVVHYLLLAATITLFSGFSHAQTLYKYRGENGEWIYSDRKPADDGGVEVRRLESSFEQPDFSVTHELVDGGIEFVAHNAFYAPIEVRLKFDVLRGMDQPDSNQTLRWVVEPRSDVQLLNLEIRPESEEAPYVEFRFEYMLGDPLAQHTAGDGYRAPFAAGVEFPITQAYPSTITHQSVDSRHAIDLAMPVGTDIVAARAGVVFDVAANNYRGGVDRERDAPAANIVRILHDDGTFALYAHLNWNSIRVKPGDRVRQGEYIADSGNTGFSSGPHLHFSVQKNAGLRIQSLPVWFKGIDANKVVPRTGDLLAAYH